MALYRKGAGEGLLFIGGSLAHDADCCCNNGGACCIIGEPVDPEALVGNLDDLSNLYNCFQTNTYAECAGSWQANTECGNWCDNPPGGGNDGGTDPGSSPPGFCRLYKTDYYNLSYAKECSFNNPCPFGSYNLIAYVEYWFDGGRVNSDPDAFSSAETACVPGVPGLSNSIGILRCKTSYLGLFPSGSLHSDGWYLQLAKQTSGFPSCSTWLEIYRISIPGSVISC